MSSPDNTINPRILASAKRSFLANGYEKTSLKTICEEAGVTTGALYKRYTGKEALFCALVDQAVQDLNQERLKQESVDPVSMTDEELLDTWNMYNGAMQIWFDFLYARKDEFTLILTCSQGTRYSSFMSSWVDHMTESTLGFICVNVKTGE